MITWPKKVKSKPTSTTVNPVTQIAETDIYNASIYDMEPWDASGNVKIEDKVQKIIIFTDSITYLKNLEIILTKNNSKAIAQDGKIITADNFKYEKNENIINANGNVYLEDKNHETRSISLL